MLRKSLSSLGGKISSACRPFLSIRDLVRLQIFLLIRLYRFFFQCPPMLRKFRALQRHRQVVHRLMMSCLWIFSMLYIMAPYLAMISLFSCKISLLRQSKFCLVCWSMISKICSKIVSILSMRSKHKKNLAYILYGDSTWNPIKNPSDLLLLLH